MEALYKKLHDKYTTLKKRGFSELDEIGKDQELKFLEYVSASEEVIQHLRDERDRLSSEVSNLRDEVASLRSIKDEECAEYKKLLMEEKQKNDLLSEKIESLQKLLQERPCSSVDAVGDSALSKKARFHSPEARVVSTRSMTRKRGQEAHVSSGHNDLVRESAQGSSKGEAHVSSGHEDLVRESAQGSSAAIPITRDLLSDHSPGCFKISADQSGNEVIREKGPAYCHFQALIEYLVGMKLSNLSKTEGTSISAQHQSSGYSFSLTWVKKESEEEPELLYRVLTLGTFETVAPEWMRSTLMFRVSMCPIFFGRVSRVIKFQC